MFTAIKKMMTKAAPKQAPIQVSLPSLLETTDYVNNSAKAHKLMKIIHSIDDCNANDFNYVISELLQKMGYSTQIIDGKNDKGVDIIGFVGNQREIAVQCKAWNPKRNTEQVSKECVQSFKGATMNEYQYALFFTTHYFTMPALEAVDDFLILIDRKKLFMLLAKYFPEAFANSYYQYSIAELNPCKACHNGKLLKLYSRKSSKIYYWCENCGNVDFNFQPKS
ncbi:hypothetical protein GCM10007161_18110 [Ignatzschineria indica]|nr:restriction endonuclease [Ignatzschineria indica]GGZ86738.1 hypothetical protein GCM10007161_18110 [Ignatzschineria indica]